jgi:hypothetical protein
MLSAKFINSYPSKSGETKARYAVSGSASEIAAYELAQGDYLRHEGTSPILFADVCPDESRTYKINLLPSGRYILDLSSIYTASGASEAVDKRSKSASFKKAFADIKANSLAGTTLAVSSSSALQAAVAEEAPEPAAADLTEPIITSAKKG